MVLLGRRSQGFGEHRVRRDAQRQLPPPGARRRPSYFAATPVFVIYSRRSPLAVGNVTSSPRLWPSRALPIGDSFESFISVGLASADPTIMYLVDLFPSLTCTTDPTRT